MTASSTPVDIYTDGACSPNPGPGGWGALIVYGAVERELCGGEAGTTTNNRMELTAPIEALRSLTPRRTVRLYTDSIYVRDGITKWMLRWKLNGWRTAAKQPVKNVDLWRLLDAAVGQHDVRWHWVKGHAGHPGNERADRLAARGMAGALAAPRAATSTGAGTETQPASVAIRAPAPAVRPAEMPVTPAPGEPWPTLF